MKRLIRGLLSAFIILLCIQQKVIVSNASGFEITKQPVDVSALVGDDVVFSVEANEAASYQWQYSRDNGVTWTSWVSEWALTPNLSLNVTQGRLAMSYRCLVTSNTGETLTTNPVKIFEEEFKITQQPEDARAFIGDNVTFTCEAVGAASYQWQYSRDNGATWTSWSATSTWAQNPTVELNVTAVRVALRYRCVVTSAHGVTLASRTVKIIENEFAITKQPTDVYARIGEDVEFSVEAVGAASYQWQYSRDNGTTWTSWSETSTWAQNPTVSMNVTAGRLAMKYRCLVTSTQGDTLASEAVSIFEDQFKITQQPQDANAAVGDDVEFSVLAVGATSYQWQYSRDNGATWTSWSESSTWAQNPTISLNVTQGRLAMVYRCIVTSSRGETLETNVVKILDNSFRITKQPENVSAFIGQDVEIGVEAIGAVSYQWQYSRDNGATWTSWSASSTWAQSPKITLNVTTARIALRYRCVVTSASGATLESNVVKISEKKFGIIEQPTDVVASIGEDIEFTVNAIGAVSYQWQYSRNDGVTWSSWAANSTWAQNPIVSLNVTQGRLAMVYRCLLTSAQGETIVSDTVRIIEAKFEITKQPEDVRAQIGDDIEFSLEATMAESYQWQYSRDNGKTWASWASTSTWAQNPTISLNVTQGRLAMVYRCLVTSTSGETLISDVVKIIEGSPLYTVTYDAGRGMFPATKQKTYVVTAEPGPYYLDNYGEDMVPVLDGYEFHGWLYQGKFVEQVNLTSNIVLTPMWVQVFDLVFDANGGHFPDATTQAVTTKTIKVGPGTHRLDNVMDEPIPDPIRNGYIFVGWLYNNKIVKKVKITDASVTVVAQWQTAYQVTYDADGGTMSWWDKQQDKEIMGAQYVTTVPAGPYYVYDAPRPWRTDATTNEYDEFVCWTQTVNGKDVRVDDCINLTANLSLKASYAKWVRITYDANGGKFDEDGSTTKEDGARSGPFKSYWVTDGNGRNVSRDNYSFLGWSTQANATTGDNNFDAFLTEDTTYYAVWSEKPVITYDANGGYFYHKDVYDQNGQQVFDDHGNPEKEAVTIETRGMELGEGRVDGFGVNFDGPCQFIGWSTDAKATTATYQPGDPITITGSIRLYAVFKQMPTIVYNANGGGWGHYEPIPSATEGGDATEQFVIDDYYKMHWDNAGFYYYVGCDSPERPGYEFLGWYTTSGEDGLKADDDELVLAEGATYYYYAHWAKRVTVTYVTNEPNTGWGWWNYQYGENGVKSVVFEQTSFTCDTIAGSDYKIDGWRPNVEDSPIRFLGYTTNPKGTEAEYEVDDSIVLTDDITLYAVWVQNPTIHYVCDEKDAGWNGFWDDVDGDGEREYVFETQERLDWRNLGEHEYYVYYVGFEAPERPGYEFDHWVDDQGVNADDRALTLHDGDVYTFHATWRRIVTVTYTTNIGGWGWYDNDAPEGEKYEYVEFNNYDRDWGDMWTGEYHVDGWTPNCCDGPYEFVGYATDEDATEATLQPGQKITLTDDTTFFAIWKQLPTIIYDGNGGGWGEYDEDEDMYEESIKLDWRTPGHYYHVRYEQPYRENYDFDGWVDAQDVPKDDVALLLADGDVYTFKAKWIPHVTIVYYANGGEFDGWEPNEGESSIRHIRHERGGEYWLDGWHPNREGYDFGGWSLTPENQQKVTEPYNLAQDTMFYAIWDELLTVTYDGNGGVWYDWAEDPTTGEYQTVTLTQKQQTDVHRGRYDVGYDWTPDREGYEFIGWARTRDSQQASERWTTEINGNTTFYAIWEKKMAITYDAGDGHFWYDEQDKEYKTTWTHYARRNEIIRVNDWVEGEPEREGYRFDGWLYNGDALRWVRASQNLTFTADWVKTYEVQLVANGGYFNSFDEDYYEGSFDTWQNGNDYVFYKQQCDDGEGYDFFNGGFPVPQRDGYTFIGWSYPSDNDENLVYAENIVINGADMELFAQWEPIPGYEPEMISANDYQ